MKFNQEFKEALSELPSKEKDKLLFRLLKKDLKLAKKLYFELVSGESIDERRQKMIKRVEEETQHITDTFYSPGYLLVDLRFLSGAITEHVNTTKDKFGEIVLNLLMLNKTLEKNRDNILKFSEGRSRTLLTYIIARAFKILLLTTKLHEDYHLDLREDTKRLGELISNNTYIMKATIYHGLDVNWLCRFEIPNNLIEIHRDLRERGYLK